MFRIGQLARRFGLNIRTIRFYEAVGLLPAPSRSESGYRLYTESDAERLDFVLHAKQLGFSLKQIRYILTLVQHDQPFEFVRTALEQRVAEIDEQVASLTRQRAELASILGEWDRSGHMTRLVLPQAADQAHEP